MACMQLDVLLDTHGKHKGGVKGSVKNQNDTTGMQRWGGKEQERAGHGLPLRHFPSLLSN